MRRRQEIENSTHYDAFIVSGEFDQALEELKSIIVMGEQPIRGQEQGRALCRQLLEEFASSPWAKEMQDRIKGA